MWPLKGFTQKGEEPMWVLVHPGPPVLTSVVQFQGLPVLSSPYNWKRWFQLMLSSSSNCKKKGPTSNQCWSSSSNLQGSELVLSSWSNLKGRFQVPTSIVQFQ
jgi:hypothetical protein